MGDLMNSDFKKDEIYPYIFIGKNIAKRRKALGMTQEELSIKSCYSKQFISNIENNVHQTFSIGTLWAIANALDIEMYKLCIEEKKDN